jgi:hypothetical protein
MRYDNLWLGLMVSMACVVAGGCTQAPSGGSPDPAAVSKEKAEVAAAPKHDHNAPGKHGGQQQLLGNHEYHAELVHNETTGEVVLFISDGEFKPVAVPEKEVFLTASVAGQPKEFTLSGDANPPEGQPRFVLVDKELCDAICKAGEGVRLNATIKGKPYAANYTAAGHDDHEHENGERDGDKHDEHPGEQHAAGQGEH